MELQTSRSLIPAAEYVRMSTGRQEYSIQGQKDVIRAYAQRSGMAVIRTYSDAGRSGLNLQGRPGLKQLIDDVQTGTADFKAILVYDVSRWGRFQNVDESAFYEYVCKRAGIKVNYCAEQFENDGTPLATIIKALKRAMAAEYSRELSVKVFAGLSRIVELGFRPGGTAGYGYRRVLLDTGGMVKSILENGERKAIASDRVKLIYGPIAEVETVRWIFSAFVNARKSELQIAAELNKKGVMNSIGRPWTYAVINDLLKNEKYVGNNVWNHISFKLKKVRLRNGPEMWLRADDAFDPIIDRNLFEAAQELFARRRHYTCRGRRRGLSDDEMLDALRQLLDRHGYLSVEIIERDTSTPSSATYHSRFGGLRRAYQLIGYSERRWTKGITPTGRPRGLSDEEMLEALCRLRQERGSLNREIIQRSKNVPSISAYYSRFGSLSKTYQLIGFTPDNARERARRGSRFSSNRALLNGLRSLLSEKGRLSRKIIDESEDAPARGTLVRRFGSLRRVYELVGYTHPLDLTKTRPRR